MAQSDMLQKGDDAPVFATKASLAGEEFMFYLEDALHKGPTVVYFYPSAYTGGCDLEARTFAENIEEFEEAETTVIGVSADNIERLNEFSADPNYCAGEFPVASDPDGKIAAKYGLEMSPEQEGAKDIRGENIDHGFIPRTTFIIDEKGEIVKVFSSKIDEITPDEHVTKSLDIVEKM